MENKLKKIFYSYSHKDKTHRENMEKHLTILRQSNLISEWSDKEILAGQHINNTILDALNSSDIIIFLISIDFLASPACIYEWNTAKELVKNNDKKIICIILRECPWTDFDDMKDYLALPYDGKPITSWDSIDSAWNNVYGEIKKVVRS